MSPNECSVNSSEKQGDSCAFLNETGETREDSPIESENQNRYISSSEITTDNAHPKNESSSDDSGVLNPENMDELSYLGTWSMDQDQLEQDVARKANKALLERENELDQKRLDKSLNQRKNHLQKIRRLEDKLRSRNIRISEKEQIRKEIEQIQNGDIRSLNDDIKDIKDRMNIRQQENNNQTNKSLHDTQDSSSEIPSNLGRHSNESEHDFLVRTGKITPFSNTFMANPNLQNVINTDTKSGMSHQQLRLPGMELDEMSDESIEDHDQGQDETESEDEDESFQYSQDEENEEIPKNEKNKVKSIARKRKKIMDESEFIVSDNEDEDDESEDSNYELSDVEVSTKKRKKPQLKTNTKNKKAKFQKSHVEDNLEDIKGLDDGDETIYKRRINSWIKKRKQYRAKVNEKNGIEDNENDTREEWLKPHPVHKEYCLDGNFKVPGDIYTSLFDYQKTGVQWQWELYSQNVGGILSDEMGLGKTIQIVAFLAGLMYSGLLRKPALIVCPATVMKQWVNEFHRWWPPLRVVILHSIGSGMEIKREEDLEQSLEDSENGSLSLSSVKKMRGVKSIIDSIMKSGMSFFFLFSFFFININSCSFYRTCCYNNICWFTNLWKCVTSTPMGILCFG